jgi:hypothetical protein
MINNIPTNESELDSKQLSSAIKLSILIVYLKFLIYSVSETIIVMAVVSYINSNIIRNDILNIFLVIYIFMRFIYGLINTINKAEVLKNGRKEKREEIRDSSIESEQE